MGRHYFFPPTQTCHPQTCPLKLAHSLNMSFWPEPFFFPGRGGMVCRSVSRPHPLGCLWAPLPSGQGARSSSPTPPLLPLRLGYIPCPRGLGYSVVSLGRFARAICHMPSPEEEVFGPRCRCALGSKTRGFAKLFIMVPKQLFLYSPYKLNLKF